MIQYRKRRKYKYNLHSTCRYATGIMVKSSYSSKYIDIHKRGDLVIHAGYSWDGPSWPARDTLNFMRGSLVHDALYQLIREGVLEPGDRDQADRILKEICLEDGMSRFRAAIVFFIVNKCAAFAARPDMITAPRQKRTSPI